MTSPKSRLTIGATLLVALITAAAWLIRLNSGTAEEAARRNLKGIDAAVQQASTNIQKGATNSSGAPSLADQIGAAGGTASLIRDCQTILAEHQKSGKEIWTTSDTSLPPTIAALQPQVVQAGSARDSFPIVDIQLSGGFTHRGLIVVLTNVPPDFAPRKSSWKVTKLSDRIFQYRE